MANKKQPFTAISSTPCFEYWLLLHFGYTDAPFASAGKKSIADQAVAQLKKKPGFTQYSKGMKNVHALLKDKTSQASSHAQRLRKNSGDDGQLKANPWTNVDELVDLLLRLK